MRLKGTLIGVAVVAAVAIGAVLIVQARQPSAPTYPEILQAYRKEHPTLDKIYKQGYGKRDTKVLIFGIDGATWDIVDPMMDDGRLPNLQRLIQRGVRGNLKSMEPTHSPALWTTVATGKLPSQHKIFTFTVPMPGDPESLAMASSLHRQVPALWNILSYYDVKVCVADWWATYPAEPVNGFVISDKASILRRQLLEVVLKTKPSDDDSEIGITYPADLMDTLRPFFRPIGDLKPEELQRFAHLTGEEVDAAKKVATIARRQALTNLIRSYLTDESTIDSCFDLLRKRSVDFMAIWLSGVDASEHMFWQYYRPGDFKHHTPDEEDIRKFKDVIPNYYEYVDEQLGRILAAMDESWTILVVSDHGHHANANFGTAEATGYFKRASGDHEDAPDGIFILAGPHIKNTKGARFPGKVNLADITPTVLYLYGIPVGRDMKGCARTELVKPEYLAANPLRKITSLNQIPWRFKTGVQLKAMTRQDREWLQGLGYTDYAISGEGQSPEEELDCTDLFSPPKSE